MKTEQDAHKTKELLDGAIFKENIARTAARAVDRSARGTLGIVPVFGAALTEVYEEIRFNLPSIDFTSGIIREEIESLRYRFAKQENFNALRFDLGLMSTLIARLEDSELSLSNKAAYTPIVIEFLSKTAAKHSDAIGSLQASFSGFQYTMSEGFEATHAHLDKGFKATYARLDSGFKETRSQFDNLKSSVGSLQFDMSAVKTSLTAVQDSVDTISAGQKDMAIVTDALFVQMTTVSVRGFERCQKVMTLGDELKALQIGGNKAAILAKTNELSAAQEKVHQDRLAFDQGLNDFGQAMGIVTGFIGLKNPKLAHQVATVSQAGIAIVTGIGALMNIGTAAASGGILGPVGMIAGAVFAIFGLFKEEQKSPEQMILDAINRLSEQVEKAVEHIDKRFDHTNKLIVETHLKTMREFSKVHKSLEALHVWAKEVKHQLNRMEMKMDRGFREIYQKLSFIGACEKAFNYHSSHPGAAIPLEKAREWYGHFRDFAQTGVSNAIMADDARDDYEHFEENFFKESDWHINALAGFAMKHGVPNPGRLANPSAYAEAVLAYLEFMYQTPEFTITTGQKTDTLAVMKVGEQFQKFVINLRLHKSLFKHLFSEYKKSVRAHMATYAKTFEKKQKSLGMQLPDDTTIQALFSETISNIFKSLGKIDSRGKVEWATVNMCFRLKNLVFDDVNKANDRLSISRKDAMFLVEKLNDDDSKAIAIRYGAVKILGYCPLPSLVLPECIKGLINVLKDKYLDSEHHSEHWYNAADLLSHLKLSSADLSIVIHLLLSKLDDSDSTARKNALKVLGHFSTPAAELPGLTKVFIEKLRDSQHMVRQEAAKSLGQLAIPASTLPGIVKILLRDLKNQDHEIQHGAAEALGELSIPTSELLNVTQALLERLKDSTYMVQCAIVKALGRLSIPASELSNVIEALLKRLNGSGMWKEIIEALGQPSLSASFEFSGLIQMVFEKLKSGNNGVREEAVEVLSRLSIPAFELPKVIQALLNAVEDEDSKVWIKASEVLSHFAIPMSELMGVTKVLMGKLQIIEKDSFVIVKALCSLNIFGIELQSLKDKIAPVNFLELLRECFPRLKRKIELMRATKITLISDKDSVFNFRNAFDKLTPDIIQELNADIHSAYAENTLDDTLSAIGVHFNLLNTFARYAFPHDYKVDDDVRNCFTVALWDKPQFILQVQQLSKKHPDVFLPVLLQQHLLNAVDRCEQLIFEKIEEAQALKVVDDQRGQLSQAVGRCDADKVMALLSGLSLAQIEGEDQLQAGYPIVDDALKDLEAFLFFMQFNEIKPTLFDQALACVSSLARAVIISHLIEKGVYASTQIQQAFQHLLEMVAVIQKENLARRYVHTGAVEEGWKCGKLSAQQILCSDQESRMVRFVSKLDSATDWTDISADKYGECEVTPYHGEGVKVSHCMGKQTKYLEFLNKAPEHAGDETLTKHFTKDKPADSSNAGSPWADASGVGDSTAVVTSPDLSNTAGLLVVYLACVRGQLFCYPAVMLTSFAMLTKITLGVTAEFMLPASDFLSRDSLLKIGGDEQILLANDSYPEVLGLLGASEQFAEARFTEANSVGERWDCQYLDRGQLHCVSPGASKMRVVSRLDGGAFVGDLLGDDYDVCEESEQVGLRVRHCVGNETEFVEYEQTSVAEPDLMPTLAYAGLGGAAFTAIPEAIGDALHLSGRLSQRNAAYVKQGVTAGLMFATGSWMSPLVAHGTSFALGQMGCSAGKAKAVGNAAGFLVSIARNLTPTGLAATGANYLGGRVGFWAEKRAAQQVVERFSRAKVTSMASV